MRAATSSCFAKKSSMYRSGYTCGFFARLPRFASHLAALATKLLLRPVLVVVVWNLGISWFLPRKRRDCFLVEIFGLRMAGVPPRPANLEGCAPAQPLPGFLEYNRYLTTAAQERSPAHAAGLSIRCILACTPGPSPIFSLFRNLM